MNSCRTNVTRLHEQEQVKRYIPVNEVGNSFHCCLLLAEDHCWQLQQRAKTAFSHMQALHVEKGLR